MKNLSKRPLIAVTSPHNKGILFWWCIKFAVWLAKGKAKRVTYKSKFQSLEDFDGFIISGGDDVNPKLYEESLSIDDSKYDNERDEFEQKIIKYAVNNKKPLLGICRGMQIINVTLGGSLHREVSQVFEDFLPHDSMISKLLGRRDIKIAKDSKLFSILKIGDIAKVNSIHHQAVNKLGEGLVNVAREENGIIQAIESKENSNFLIGVQWHPEMMIHKKFCRRIFRELVQSCN